MMSQLNSIIILHLSEKVAPPLAFFFLFFVETRVSVRGESPPTPSTSNFFEKI